MLRSRLSRFVLWSLLVSASAPCLAEKCTEVGLRKKALLKETDLQLKRSIGFDDVRLRLELIGDMPRYVQQVKLLDSAIRSRVAVELTSVACGRAKVTTAWVKVRAFKDGWVYRKEAKAGQAVSQARPRRGEIDLTRSRLAPSDLAQDIEGLWLVENVRDDMPALNRHLQREPMVKRDEVVRVVVLAHGLQISTRGRAMRQGMLGDSVPVLVERSHSSLMAVVAGKGEVHVEK